MYVKSERINSYSLSGVASNTLFLTCFPSPLVRSRVGATLKFFSLISILAGADSPLIHFFLSVCVDFSGSEMTFATPHPAEIPSSFHHKTRLEICAKGDSSRVAPVRTAR